MQRMVIEQNMENQRLDKLLHRLLPKAESSLLYQQLRKKNITLNHKKATGKELVKAGDVLECFFGDETFLALGGQSRFLAKKEAAAGESGVARASAKPAQPGATQAPAKQTQAGAAKAAAQPARVNARQAQATSPQAQAMAGQPSSKAAPTLQAQNYLSAYESLTALGLSVLYEDADILAVNKPVGVLSQKANASDESVNEWLIGYLLAEGKVKAEDLLLFKPGVCNRLDRNTSGIVLCAKTLKGARELGSLIKEHKIRKFYHAICLGEIHQAALLEGYLTKDEISNKVRVTKNAISKKSAYIKTAYSPLQGISLAPKEQEALASAAPADLTLLEVELFTGKSHQIRGHLAAIGHPILGDFKYGGTLPEAAHLFLNKRPYQLLHAQCMIFPDGRSIIAPYPKDSPWDGILGRKSV